MQPLCLSQTPTTLASEKEHSLPKTDKYKKDSLSHRTNNEVFAAQNLERGPSLSPGALWSHAREGKCASMMGPFVFAILYFQRLGMHLVWSGGPWANVDSVWKSLNFLSHIPGSFHATVDLVGWSCEGAETIAARFDLTSMAVMY